MRLVICGREPLYRDAIASLLAHEGNFDVVASESTPRACLTATKDHQAQVIVLDGSGLLQNDIEFFLGARAYGDFGVILIGQEGALEAKDHMLDTVLARQADPQDLFRAIREVGAIFIKTPVDKVREKRQNYGAGIELTRREFEVASLVGRGLSNRRIAAVTGLREQSIKNLVSVIMRKLKCENRVQVALRLTSVSVSEDAN